MRLVGGAASSGAGLLQVSQTTIVRDVLPNGLRILTERMPHVRSVSVGVWLARGSRHEPQAQSGVAHFVEHMLFKGTATRTAEDIAQTIDSIGGQMDAFTAKEYASYYIKVLDEHLPLAVEVLADIVMNPAFSAEDIEREKKVVLEEIKMVEDTPDDLVHELFTENFWHNHPLGRPILGTPETVESLTQEGLRAYFTSAYTAPNLIVAAVGNITHEQVRDLVVRAFDGLPTRSEPLNGHPPTVVPRIIIRNKEHLEQSHVCLGTSGYPQDHVDRYSSYVLNTILGGSMSSRLFQNVREKRGLAYAVFSGLSAYRDTGSMTIYAGCANHAVDEASSSSCATSRGSPTRSPRRASRASLRATSRSTSPPRPTSWPRRARACSTSSGGCSTRRRAGASSRRRAGT